MGQVNNTTTKLLNQNNMKKQTAVEWLIDEHFGGIENCTPDFRNRIEQAKQMEKEQIINFADELSELNKQSILDYYNETYEKLEP